MYYLMIVDDDEILLEGLSTTVNWAAMGLSVSAAVTDGVSALEAMRRLPCDLLLTDIRMGRMDGLALASEVRKSFAGVRVVMMSAYEDFRYAQQAVRLGVEEYLLKPIDLALLEEAMRKAVQSLAAERSRDTQLAKMSRRLEEIGEQSTEEYRRASGALNPLVIEHLCCVTALGNTEEVSRGVLRLKQDLEAVSGGSFVFLIAALSMILGRLSTNGALNARQIESLSDAQKSALAHPSLSEAVSCIGTCLETIAREISAQAQDTQGLIARACAYIDAHFHQADLRIKDVAAHVGLSSNYLSALFAKQTHDTISDYLLRCRMREAQLLLVNTGLKTYEISYRVGYDNPAYFSTCFKRFSGMTVSQYRKAFGH